MRTDLQKIFDELNRTTVGLETLFNDAQRSRIARSSNFPPYNIRRVGDTQYKIELAVAGFSKEDIDIELEKNVITVSSKGHDTDTDTGDFIHQGFTYRGFERTFTLMDNVRVVSADLINGILEINLERVIPEEDKPRKISIGFGTPKQTLLTE